MREEGGATMRISAWLAPKQPWARPNFGRLVLSFQGSSQRMKLSTQILPTGMLLLFSIVMELLLLAMCELHIYSPCVASVTLCVMVVFVVLCRPEPVVWNGTKLYFRWVKR